MEQPSLYVSKHTIMTSRGHFVWPDDSFQILQESLSHQSALWDVSTLLLTGDILPVHCPQINSSNVISHQLGKLVGKDLIHNCINPCVVAHCVYVCVCVCFVFSKLN